jgi:uncharacterized protein with PQ loop repeat
MVMDLDIPVVAGAISTMMFAASTLPMLVKAARTKDLGSYSLGNIVLSNVGNLVHSVYVFSLPAGPVWVLHTFYLISTGLMLLWYVRYAVRRTYTEIPTFRLTPEMVASPDAAGATTP